MSNAAIECVSLHFHKILLNLCIVLELQVTCLSEMKIRYDGSVVDLKQRMGILFNRQAVSVNQLPVKVGHVLVKQASHDVLQGNYLAHFPYHQISDIN
jgi:hypothetical protein